MEVKGIENNGYNTIQYEQTRTENTASRKTDALSDAMPNIENNTQRSDDMQLLSEEAKQNRMQRLQETLKNHNVEISYNEEVNRYAIKVLDSETKEVVKEIPSEKTLDMFARMLELEGLLMDEKR